MENKIDFFHGNKQKRLTAESKLIINFNLNFGNVYTTVNWSAVTSYNK